MCGSAKERAAAWHDVCVEGSARERAAWHDVCVEVQENVQRSMTYVWKCKRTYYVVAVTMSVNIPPHPTPTPPPTPTPKISTRAWPLAGVGAKNINIYKDPLQSTHIH